MITGLFNNKVIVILTVIKLVYRFQEVRQGILQFGQSTGKLLYGQCLFGDNCIAGVNYSRGIAKLAVHPRKLVGLGVAIGCNVEI